MGSGNLYLVTGTSAAGKSSAVVPLRCLLGEGWEVWDIDDIVWNLPDHGHPEMPRLTGWKHGDDQSDSIITLGVVDMPRAIRCAYIT